AGAYRDRQPVLARREWAGPADVVGARGVVGEIEVDREVRRAGRDFEDEAIGVLHGVEEVAPAAVGFPGRGSVAEGEKQAPAIADQAENRQPAVLAAETEAQQAGAAIGDDAVLTAGVDYQGIAGLGGLQSHRQAIRRIVVEIREAVERCPRLR